MTGHHTNNDNPTRGKPGEKSTLDAIFWGGLAGCAVASQIGILIGGLIYGFNTSGEKLSDEGMLLMCCMTPLGGMIGAIVGIMRAEKRRVEHADKDHLAQEPAREFGFWWQESPAHLRLLSEFLHLRAAEDFSKSGDWEKALGETPQKAIECLLERGLLVRATPAIPS